jgi:hypothetical protein
MVQVQNMGGKATKTLMEVFFEGELSAVEAQLASLG